MTPRFLIIALLLLSLLGSVSPGAAQEMPIFMYGNVRQYAEVQYLYAGSGYTHNGQGGGADSSITNNRNAVTPAYSVSTDYAVYDPRLLHGSASLYLKYDMNMVSRGDGSGSNYNNLDLNYNINGKILEKKLLPVTFFAQREQQWIQQDFSAGYNQTIETYGVGVTIRNAYLPTQLLYSWSGSDSSSGDDSWSQKYHLFTLQSANKAGKYSYTTLTLNYNQSDNSSSTTVNSQGKNSYYATNYSMDNLILTLNNSLTWDFRSYHNKRVQSVVTFDNSSGLFSSRSCNLSESAFLDFGRALQSAVAYTFNSSEYGGGKSISQSTTSNTGSAWVNHKLFDSLSTHLDVAGTKSDYNTGSTGTISGGGSLGYTKNLPRASTLQLQVSQRYGVTDRDLTSAVQIANNEKMTLSLNYPQNQLANGNVDGSFIPIVSIGPVVYSNIVDYTVVTHGSFTYLDINVASSHLKAGDAVTVTYQYLVDPTSSFSTTTFATNANLSLFENRYRLFAYYNDISQNLISGRSDMLYLSSQSSLRIGGEMRVPSNFLAVEYSRVESDNDRRDSVQGRWALTPPPFGVNVVTASVVDTYSWYRFGGSMVAATSGTDNLLSVQTTYARPLLRNGMFRLSLNYLMTRGSSIDRDVINGTMNYQMKLGKFYLVLDASTNWLWLSASAQNDTTVRLLLRRYF